MTYQLKDLLEDSRLQRLFLSENKPCALQLWILQIKKNNFVENRLVYGRLLPYSFSKNGWTFSDKDTSQGVDDFRVSVTQLNLYLDSSLCSDLLRMICMGQSIDLISKSLNLTVPPKLSKQYGNTILINNDPIFRPVIYLVNRDSNLQNELLSPHGSAGALSAAVSITNKNLLFFFDGIYNRDLTSIVLKRLKEDTGMDFGKNDINRLGEIELLVFPTLDDKEKNLLTVKRTKYKELSVKFISTQIPAFEKFQFSLVCENKNNIISSKIALAQSTIKGVFEYHFDIDEKLFKITDATKIDIFGFKEDDLTEGSLCCSWKITYIKEINLSMQVIGNQLNPVKFDWLEKTVSPKKNDRVAAVLASINNRDISKSRIKGDVIDLWVEENQKLRSIFDKLNPSQSNGRFFLQWGKSDGEGRLPVVEWFKELLEKNENKHIAIFDPYFEDVGLSLLTLYASSNAQYSIFRSIPKPLEPNVPRRRKTDNLVQTGIDNLITNCEQNRKILQSKNIKIYGLKDGNLHDRYILVIDNNGLPIEGYHLSNSFQKATENYPLLITPIPVDILYKTNQYTFELINKLNQKNDSSYISILFDSKNILPNKKIYEPLRFLDDNLAGKILSIWLQQPSLEGKSGIELINEMKDLGVLKDESLHDLPEGGLYLCLTEIDGKLADFMESWKVIGEILARTITGDQDLEKLQNERKFLLFLSKFLSTSFQRDNIYEVDEVSVINLSYFKKTFLELLQTSIWVHSFFQSTKYNILNWAEFYAVKYLWMYEPKLLIALMEKELESELCSADIVKLSLLGQIVSEISLSVELDALSEEQLNLLIGSNIALIRWFGWNALEQRILALSDLNVFNKKLSNFNYIEKIQFIAWMLNRNNEKPEYSVICKDIVIELISIFPEKIPYQDLETFIDVAKGHMRKLSWSGAWLFNDIIKILLDNKRVSFDEICKFWLKELIEILNLEEKNNPLIFSSEREGNLINISAYLWANSDSSLQLNLIKNIEFILKNQSRIIQQPLASTLNWSKWNDALTISMWISVFTKLCKYYLSQLNIQENDKLDILLENSLSLAMTRPLAEWNTESELIKFSEWVNGLSSNKNNSNSSL
ncbi:VPA1262 family protein [Acinetobacter soli]|uniref:VPA1262 family protein n=1 Tax=Acinetobacter soli TaxID=487316 RepID=UPI003AA892B1